MTICKVRDAQHDGGAAAVRPVLAGLLLLTLSLLAPGQASAQEPIRWDRVEGATVVGDTVAQAGTAQTSGAVSIQFIASGDGAASFVAVDATTTKALGLSTSPDLEVSSLRYGLMLGADGTVSVVENGAVSSPAGGYQAGDAFSIGVESGVAVIRHNGVQVHLSSVPVAYPLFAEILTIGTGSAVTATGIGGSLGESVQWANLVNASSPSAGVIVSSPGAPYGGGVSTKAILAGDGYVEFTVDDAAVLRRIGLSSGDTDQSPTDIDFGLHFYYGNAYAYSFESAQVSTPFVVGDVFRIGVEGGVVKYRKNGVLFHTSVIAPSYPLLVDTSMYYAGTGFSEVTITGLLGEVGAAPVTFSPNGGEYATAQEVTLQTVTSGAAIHYTLDGTTPTESSPSVLSGGTVTVPQSSWLKAKAFAAGLFPGAMGRQWYSIDEPATTEAVEWTNLVKASSPSAGLIVSSAGAPYGGGVSTKAILAGDGYVEFTVEDAAVLRRIGLSNGDTDQSPADIDFGLQLYYGNAYAFSFESAQVSTPFVVGDVFRIGVEGGVVKYRKNGVLFHTNVISPSYPLLVDTSMYYAGTGFSGVTISGLLGEVGAAPVTFSPPGGEYTTAQEVTLQTVTSGAVIHYTLDGTTPTESSPSVLSGGTVMVTQSSWLKAKAFAAGLFPGAMGRQWYSIDEPATTEAVEWTNLVKASSPSAGVIMSSAGAPYGGGVSTKAILAGDGYVEFTVEDAAVLRRIGLSNGDTDQSPTDIDFGLHLYYGNAYAYSFESAQVSTPFVVGDVFRIGVEGGVVKYRKNGVLFHTNGIAPSYPLLVDASMYYAGTGFSGVTISGHLTDVTAQVVFTPPAGNYTTSQLVALTSPAAGATIRYTTDGSEPTASSPIYSSPISVVAPNMTTLKAFAVAPGYINGVTTTAVYTFDAAEAPVFSPPGGSFLGPLAVTATTATPGAAIHYTFNGADPSPSSPSVVSGELIAIALSGTLKAIAVAPGLAASPTTSATYELVAVPPTISPEGGSFSGPVEVTLQATPGATIRYTTDGGVPDETSAEYTAPFTLTTSATVTVRAFVAGWSPSASVSASYDVQVAAPVLSVPGGTYATRRSVVATTATPGALIHYTTNGQEPTETDPSVASGGVILVNRALVLKARAFKAGTSPSDVSRADYLITGAVAFGSNFTLFLKEDGTVWSTGHNSKGQLGLGDTTQRQVPTQIPETGSFHSIKAVEAGSDFSLFLKEDGTVWASGVAEINGTGAQVNTPVQLTAITVPIVRLAAGDDHAIAVDETGRIWTWGYNWFGQLGTGSSTSRFQPCNPLLPPCEPSLTGVVGIAAGTQHSLALLADGTVKSWGGNTFGALGIGVLAPNGNVSPSALTTPATAALPGPVVQVRAEYRHSLALTATGEVLTWGDNESGAGGRGEQLGKVPAPGVVMSNQRLIAAGLSQGYAASFTGPIWVWGQGSYGSMGDGTTKGHPAPGPTLPVPARHAIEAGSHSAAALTMSGQVYVWGLNGNGQLGINSTIQIRSTPQWVPDPAAPANPFVLVDNAWLLTDDDGDGLTAGQELVSGLDPFSVDSNGDGTDDATAYLLGGAALSTDPDGDGLPTLVEHNLGTNPHAADSDGDGVADNLDAFPLDSSRSANPVPDPNDHTAPTITILAPRAAQPIS